MLTEEDIRRIVREEIAKAVPLIVVRLSAEQRLLSAKVARRG